jgi:hypothetical protein
VSHGSEGGDFAKFWGGAGFMRENKRCSFREVEDGFNVVMEKGWVLFICLFRGVRILHFLCMSIFLNQRIDPKSEMQFIKSNISQK